MNRKPATRKIAALLVVSLAVGLRPADADPVEAEDVAYRMAKTYLDRSFVIAPTDNFGLLGQGQVIQFLVPVNRGLDYVFLAGTDGIARDVDINVYDEVGNLILDDRRSQKNAGVQFRSSYNGTASVFLHMANADGIASWCVLVGRRGEGKRSLGGGGQAPPPPPPSGGLTFTNQPADPDLKVSGEPSKLIAVAGTASNPSKFAVSGSALKSQVYVKAPDGFQVSKDGVDFSRSLAIQPSAGDLGETTIMVRLDPGAQPNNSLAGEIVITTEGAKEQKSVPVTGAVSPAGP